MSPKYDTWSTYLSNNLYNEMRRMDANKLALVRKAAGGKKFMVGQQVGNVIGNLRNRAEYDAIKALETLIDSLNREDAMSLPYWKRLQTYGDKYDY